MHGDFSATRRLALGAVLAGVAAVAAVLAGLQASPARTGPNPARTPIRTTKTWIPMPDGVRLAATLYSPADGKRGAKYPAILEYLPYRKDDGGDDHYGIYASFVRHGYVVARVDIRGTGGSEGHPPDREYSETEQRDGEEVIGWLARQSWSAGSVGMFGISWGGFNSIQMAARRPPALKAIIAVDATEDLFQDDIHFIDGQMHIDIFELQMDVQPLIPPSPDYVLDEKVLAARFDNPPWSLLYEKQQRGGPFWDRASTIGRYDRIQIPVFLIGGWLDGYRDSVPRMVAGMKTPVKALIGPWNHSFPHDAVPGPEIEWRRDAVRWWDQWLKGRDTGIMEEPRVTVYMRQWHPPDPNLENIPGEWRSEQTWPPAGTREVTWHLDGDHRLVDAAGATTAVHELKYVPSVGLEAGFWWGEIAPDQRPADAYSLVYDSAPLPEEIAILGFPRALLKASASAPLAHWFARLSDVAPDGSVTQITGAGLNGAHRLSDRDPEPLEPGRVYPIDIEMHVTSWIFPKGHRIRLAVNNACFPMNWPTPYPMTTTLRLGGVDGSRLVLPVVPRQGPSRPVFAPPDPDEPAPGYKSGGGSWPGNFSTHRDVVKSATRIEWSGTSSTEYPFVRSTDAENLTYEVSDADPAHAAIHGAVETTLTLKDRVLTFRGALEITSDEKAFHYRHRRVLLRDGTQIREKVWEDTIPRDHQ